MLLLLGVKPAVAQQIVFSGRVTEAESGKPVPFASVFVPGSSQGKTADEKGRYELAVDQPVDSLGASSLGFRPVKKAVGRAPRQIINFALPGTGAVTLGEVVVHATPGENPAFRIMRAVQDHKDRNNKRNLEAFEYDSYSRTAVFITDLPPKQANSGVIRAMRNLNDSMARRRGVVPDSTGKPALPIFASEVLSRVYGRSDPQRKREEIQHNQMHGLAPRENSVLSQMLGSSFQDWNFYPNWQLILTKDFVSPIADGWKFSYDYVLQDSVYIGRDYCYQLGVSPRRPEDLAFTGTIWVTTDTYALRRVNLHVDPRANLNFVEKLTVQQDLVATNAGPGLPQRTHVVVELKPLSNSSAFRADITTINSNFKVNEPHPLPFYSLPLETLPSAFDPVAPGFWTTNRPDSLSAADQTTLAVLDSVRELPKVRNLLDIIDIVANNYVRVGKLDLGPVLSTVGYNNVEGLRPQVGFRTTPGFSRDWLLSAYLAYGTKDGRFKYDAQATRILDRRTWTVVNAERRHDIEQLALLDNAYALENPLYEAFARVGNIKRGRPLLRDLTSISIQRDLFRGFTQRVMLRRQRFQPLYRFAYYTDDVRPGAPTADNFSLSEIVLESRYARDEVQVQNQNRRYPVGIRNRKWPVFTFRYTLGVNNFLGSDFRYQKFNFVISQSVRLGQLGRTDYIVDAGYIPTTVPYPVLKTHLGNQSLFYNAGAFNLMRYFEFVSDRYASVQFDHHFGGFLVNSVPLFKKLDWRLVATGSLLYGGARQENRALIPLYDTDGSLLPTFNSLGRTPYAEIGYGMENIFKIVRLDFLHRLTYRSNPNAQNFGVRLSLRLNL